ncbi:MAG: MerR family transcriptional regulator [Myxococcota bacterium]
MGYTVKAVSKLAGVSVRTLHHYDAIGLLKPAQVSGAGYRLYSDDDLQRLQQILFFRELEFSLQEVADIMNDPTFDRRQALLNHKHALMARQQELRQLIKTIDRTLDSLERNTPMKDKEMFEGFDPSKYEEEAKQRWGNTPAWKESQRRTKKYTKEDWAAIKQEASEITNGIASRMDRGPSDPEVQQYVQRFHQHINDRYYTCPAEMFRGLGDMYVQDERFTANYERIKPGLAQFMRSAMHVYCDRLLREAER